MEVPKIRSKKHAEKILVRLNEITELERFVRENWSFTSEVQYLTRGAIAREVFNHLGLNPSAKNYNAIREVFRKMGVPQVYNDGKPNYKHIKRISPKLGSWIWGPQFTGNWKYFTNEEVAVMIPIKNKQFGDKT